MTDKVQANQYFVLQDKILRVAVPLHAFASDDI